MKTTFVSLLFPKQSSGTVGTVGIIMPVNRIPARHADMGQTVSTSGLLPVVGEWKIKRVLLQRHDFIGSELEEPAWYKY